MIERRPADDLRAADKIRSNFELSLARAAESATVDEATAKRTVAEEGVAELEGKLERATQAQERSRVLAEARLEEVERQLQQEERESGVLVRNAAGEVAPQGE